MKSDGGKNADHLSWLGLAVYPEWRKILDMSRWRSQSVEMSNPSDITSHEMIQYIRIV